MPRSPAACGRSTAQGARRETWRARWCCPRSVRAARWRTAGATRAAPWRAGRRTHCPARRRPRHCYVRRPARRGRNGVLLDALPLYQSTTRPHHGRGVTPFSKPRHPARLGLRLARGHPVATGAHLGVAQKEAAEKGQRDGERERQGDGQQRRAAAGQQGGGEGAARGARGAARAADRAGAPSLPPLEEMVFYRLWRRLNLKIWCLPFVSCSI